VNAVGAKSGISILGEANSGKTRLAYEVLTQTLPDWPVLRWKLDFTVNQASPRAKHLVIFIDDLQNYASAQTGDSDRTIITADPRATTLSSDIKALRQDMERVIVVATCRLEDEDQVKAEPGLGDLYSELMVIPIELNIKDESKVAEYIAKFQSYGSKHVQDWDGTLGSLVLGLKRKNNEYLRIQKNPAATILRAMKLLTAANILMHNESLLQAVCADVFGENEFLGNKKKWEDAIELLLEKQFVTEEPVKDSREWALVIRKESYFDEVITDYPMSARLHQLERDFTVLLEVWAKLKDVSALFDFGSALQNLGRLDEALKIYLEVLTLRRELQDRSGEATTPNNIGQVYQNMGNFNEALKYHLEAEPIRIEVNDRVGLAATRNNIGAVYQRMGQPDKAIEYYQLALPLISKSGNRIGESTLLSNLAMAFQSRGQTDLSLDYNQKALSIMREIKNRPGEGITLNNLGRLFQNTGQFEQALDSYQQALPIIREIGNHAIESVILKNMAMLLNDHLKRQAQALSCMEQAIAVLEQAGLKQDALGRTTEDLRQVLDGMRTDKQSPQAQ
jgi:tetratricopeptide (TPR) repeat protein